MGDIAQNHFYNYNDVLTHKDIIQYTVYFSYTGCPKKHDRRGVYRDFLGGGGGVKFEICAHRKFPPPSPRKI